MLILGSTIRVAGPEKSYWGQILFLSEYRYVVSMRRSPIQLLYKSDDCHPRWLPTGKNMNFIINFKILHLSCLANGSKISVIFHGCSLVRIVIMEVIFHGCSLVRFVIMEVLVYKKTHIFQTYSRVPPVGFWQHLEQCSFKVDPEVKYESGEQYKARPSCLINVLVFGKINWK